NFTICVVTILLLVEAPAMANTTFWMNPSELANMSIVYSEPAGGT
ncbi:unnamed protein product, partial [marine sediment metagenome]